MTHDTDLHIFYLIVIIAVNLIILGIHIYVTIIVKRDLNSIVLDVKEVKGRLRHLDSEFSKDSNLNYTKYTSFTHKDSKDEELGLGKFLV